MGSVNKKSGKTAVIKKAALLVAAVIFCCLSAAPVAELITAASASESEVKALEDKLAKAAAARKKAEQAVSEAKSEKADAIKTKQAIDKKLLALSEEIAALEQVITGYELSIELKNNEIDDKLAELERLYGVVRERIRIKREDGNTDLLALILDADGLRDFFMELDRYVCMLDYDERLMNSYRDGLDSLNSMKSSLEDSKNQFENRKDELELRRLELEADRAAAEKLIADAEKDAATAEATLAKVAAEEERYNREREEKLAELQKTSNQSYVGGAFQWPLPSKYTTVSCGFGWRTHPVTGKPQFHNGIDIPAAYGTEIYACNSGTVVEVSYNYADGNYVTISHGGGIATFYSHLSRTAVKVGDKVSRGQVIAYVGTSGYTTGSHLNLNIYKDSTAVDPMDYFK